MVLEHVLDAYNCEIPYSDMQIIVHRFTRMETDGGLFAPVHMHKDYEFHYVDVVFRPIAIEDEAPSAPFPTAIQYIPDVAPSRYPVYS